MSDKPKRYMTPCGHGLEENPNGLAYRKEEVDAYIADLSARVAEYELRLQELEAERDGLRDAYTGAMEDKRMWKRRTKAAEQRAAELEAKLAEAEANINIKAEWIEATINDMAAKEQEMHEMQAKMYDVTERAFKHGLRYSINVKISDEHDVQTTWDWSQLKQDAIKELTTNPEKDTP